MKTMLIITIIMFVGCIKKEGLTGPIACKVVKTGSIATITCPDGTSATVNDGANGAIGVTGSSGSQGPAGNNGSNGSNGQNGLNGSNGHSAAISTLNADVSLCANGGSIISLGVDLNDNTVLELSEVTQTAVLCNGLNGTNAPPTAFTPVAIVNPCGDAPGIDDEVFLKLSNGTLLWSESQTVSGNNTRLSLSRPGTWVTTDGDNCVFTLDSSFNITYENHHY